MGTGHAVSLRWVVYGALTLLIIASAATWFLIHSGVVDFRGMQTTRPRRPPTVEFATAEDLVAAYFERHGGRDRRQALDSYSIWGRWSDEASMGLVNLSRRRPGSIRTAQEWTDGQHWFHTAVGSVDGREIWAMDDEGPRTPTRLEASLLACDAPFDPLFDSPQTAGCEQTFFGKRLAEQTEFWCIELRMPDGFGKEYYFNRFNFGIDRIRTTVPASEAGPEIVRTETFSGAYLSPTVGMVPMPLEQTVEILEGEARFTRTIHWQGDTITTDLTQADFELPTTSPRPSRRPRF